MNLARKMARKGVLSRLVKADGTVIGVKKVDAWWQNRKPTRNVKKEK